MTDENGAGEVAGMLTSGPEETTRGKVITFYSYKGGTGRTMSLANTAWILASGGKRVLVVDWDLDAPGLDRFLHPFLDQDRLRTAQGIIDLFLHFNQTVMEQRRQPETHAQDEWETAEAAWVATQAHFNHCVIPIDWAFSNGGRLDYVSPGTQNKEYLSAYSQFDWMRFLDHTWHGPVFVEALKQELTQNYDYVLIDSRTGLSDVSDVCTVLLPDVLVVAFTPSSQGMDGAQAVAQKIDSLYGYRGIRIIPVPMRVEDANGEADRLEAAREQMRAKFADIVRRHCSLDAQEYWGKVEIPYRPFYAYEELLAPFRDAPGSPTSMLAACERLTEVISGGDVTAFPRLDDTERKRVLALYKRPRPLQNTDIHVSFVPEDRTWADWIEFTLKSVGFQVHLLSSSTTHPSERSAPDPTGKSATRTLAVLSHAYRDSVEARAAWETTDAVDGLGNRRTLVTVRVDDVRMSPPFSDRAAADLARCGPNEEAARQALLNAVEAPTQPLFSPAAASDRGPRFPGAEPFVFSLPIRNPSFTGREELLGHVRERLRAGNGTVLLRGMGGVGKTMLALEFAHRFKSDYDVVWHIQADQRNLAVEQFAGLAGHLEISERKNPTATAAAVKDALRLGRPYSRWLLILDNVEHVNDLSDLLVSSKAGHVLITSQRSEGWERYAEIADVGVFEREESVAHLKRRLTECSTEEADEVASALGDLPLAVEHAAAVLKESGLQTQEYVKLLERQPAADTAGLSPDDRLLDVSKTWSVAIGQLNKNFPPAVQLLKLAAWFSPEPISMDLLQSTQIAQSLTGQNSTRDQEFRPRAFDSTEMIARAFQELSRLSLATVDRKSRSLRVHRLVQMSVRLNMTKEDQEATRDVVFRTLVAARPEQDDPEDHNTWERYRIIWPHLGTSWALAAPDYGIRKLIVDRVRQLRRRGELKQAYDLSTRVHQGWREHSGPDERWVLHMGFQIANILRAQGRYQEALELDTDVLHRQEAALDSPHDLHILMTSGGVAADLRGLGRYSEALDRDRLNHEQFLELFGEDHPRSLMAANNYAVCLRVLGQYTDALRLDRKTMETRNKILGPEHAYTRASTISYARDLLDCGDYAGSELPLRRTYDQCLSHQQFGASAPTTINAGKALSGALHQMGRAQEAEVLTRTVLSNLPSEEGSASPNRLLLHLGLAGILGAQGRTEEALELARRVLDDCRRFFQDQHPYTAACYANLAVLLYTANEAASSLAHAEQAARVFAAIFDDDHPFTLMCRVNLANAQAALGQRGRARATYEEVLDRLRDVLNDDQHPAPLVCAANLAVVLNELGESEAAERLREEVLGAITARLGADHPRALALREWSRSGWEFDPHPI
ncbi:FxSxx-COOH system tetratricopeptide repeat protein [Streptomyces sp. NBC_01092]|uniref:FxSxx-COOH system tetratricopeptide repeat protein n=1 Tax=Streptomyces sp. NBC_01092 TaxID=2903748 RepID=UPI00386C6462|nr:FxSxx-COOH system tetratricopeptide repeat protein [Streptomyces sp. NBC_01092]